MKLISILITSLLLATTGFAQKNAVDKIIAIVGDEIILQSDIENGFLQASGSGAISAAANYKAQILEQLLLQKMLIAQAKIDSIEVADDEVQEMVEDRINNMVAEIGSIERLEKFFGKNIDDLRSEMWEPFRNNITAERMKSKIVEKIRITPSEVREFYKKSPKDSLPEIGAKYEVQQIVMKPEISNVEKERIRSRLREFREQVLSGEKSFRTLAVLYSDDPGSAGQGGEMDYTAKTDWDPAFAEAAFSLKPGKISKIVESEFGYHIIQMIDIKGDKAKVRHILLQPKADEKEIEVAIQRLDSVRGFIMENEMTFEEAALYFSTDKNTKNNGGIISSPNGDIKLPKTSIIGEMARVVNRMNVGQISEPFEDITRSGIKEYKIIKLKAYFPQHIANLDEDWTLFEDLLKNEKQNNKLQEWVKEKQASTYIHISDDYKNAKFSYDGWIK